MSKTIELLLKGSTPEEQRQHLGIVPTSVDAAKVLAKLESFGKLGTKGFDHAIAALGVLAGAAEHEELPVFKDGAVQMFSRPFNLPEPVSGDDLGFFKGFTYGLHILPKNMADVELKTFQPDLQVACIAENTSSGRVLLAQRTTRPEEAAFETGYFGVYPSNAASIASYLVLPKPDALTIIQNASQASLV